MVSKFDKRPAIVMQQRTTQIGGTGSQIAALGNVTGTLGVVYDGYTLIGIENPVVSGHASGSPYAVYISGTQVKIINVSTVALRPQSGLLLLDAILVWGRSDLVASA